MTAPLKDLQRDLEGALERGDRERIAEVRRLIVERFPDSDVAAEARYKLGLDALFFDADLDAAVDHFRAATKSKTGPWGAAARVSLGMALFRQGKGQQAVFELRKAAGVKPPTVAAAHALLLVSGFVRQLGNAAEADRARAEAMKLLDQLAKTAPAEDQALAHFLLGMEHKFEGRRDRARSHLEKALAAKLDPLFAGKAQAALSEL